MSKLSLTDLIDLIFAKMELNRYRESFLGGIRDSAFLSPGFRDIVKLSSGLRDRNPSCPPPHYLNDIYFH